MNKTKNKVITWAVILGVVGLGIFLLIVPRYSPGDLDGLAQCLTDKGATFYGAFWCPHCQNQKKMFGNSTRLLTYVECSTPDGRGQLPVCQEKKISGYPTWEFADGSRLSGEIKPEILAEKAGCPLPSADGETTSGAQETEAEALGGDETASPAIQ